MILNILIRFCFISFFAGSSHDVPIAVFKIYDSGDEVRMKANIDLEDYLKSTKSTEKPDISALATYLSQNVIILLDSEAVIISVHDVRLEEDHLIINALLSISVTTFSEIEIQNTVLNDIESHSNIIQIELGTEERDFRMHRDRTTIKVCL